ncbi:MAG TPA: DUF3135 domain-containing protein [Gammaproteobacteria bacterium]|nr:DUF3135 domain-containing protein [Gammaproteobacteria bacterium]
MDCQQYLFEFCLDSSTGRPVVRKYAVQSMQEGDIPYLLQKRVPQQMERVMGSTQKQYKPHVDFDEMLALAKTDPATFEAKRTEYIESFLTGVPAEKQARLRGLQWQIDQTRQLARTPMASCIAISSMMWDSLRQLGNQQRELVELSIRQTPQFASTKKSAPAAKGTIIPFPAR